MDKTKIYCQGSPELKKVLKEIEKAGFIIINDIEYSDNPKYYYAYSVTTPGTIGFSELYSYWITNCYTEVFPSQFREAWLGSDPNKICFKQTVDNLEFSEKRPFIQELESLGFSNRRNFVGNSPNSYYGIINNEIRVYSNLSDYKVVSKKEFMDYWRNHAPMKDKSDIKKICCKGDGKFAKCFNILCKNGVKANGCVATSSLYYYIKKYSDTNFGFMVDPCVPPDYIEVSSKELFLEYWLDKLSKKDECISPESKITLIERKPLKIVI